MEGRGQSPHVAILSSPGMGHLIPLSELANRLLHHHGFTATVITFSDLSSKAQDSFLADLPAGVSSSVLPPARLDGIRDDAHFVTLASVVVARSLHTLRDVLRRLKDTTRLTAFVVDLFGVRALDVAGELGVPRYLFYTSAFMSLSLMLHLPAIDESTSCEFRDLPEPVRLPGCVPFSGEDMLEPMKDRTNEAYWWLVDMAKHFRDADGVLVNSFEAMEPAAAGILMERQPGRPPIYPVGPLVRTGSTEWGGGWEWLKMWLDEQPRGSVLFVSFGSGGVLPVEQLRELAAGLEMSRQRFLWVVRSLSDGEKYGNFVSSESGNDPFEILPEGFMERTKETGLVVRSWAPQMEVLAHAATGGFLSHCGWNSTLESVVHGVPMAAWPLYAEQRMNAVMLAEGLGVALRPAVGADGVVGREEIARVVKELMAGEAGQAAGGRMRELQVAGAKALSEGGASLGVLTQVATKWKAPGAM